MGLYLPVFTLVAGSVTSYLWSDIVRDTVLVILAPVVQWFHGNPLSLIPVFFWLMLLVAVLVLPLCSWFCIDPHPFTRREL